MNLFSIIFRTENNYLFIYHQQISRYEGHKWWEQLVHEKQMSGTYFNNLLNAQFLYSITICMLHYNPRHVSSVNMPIFRRTNFIITHLESSLSLNGCTVCRMRADTLLSSGVLYSLLQRVTIPDAVIIKFVLLKMGMLTLETCRGL